MTAYGLFVEHYQKYEVIWNGNGGRTYFFQNEMPYDPPAQVAWRTGAEGYAAYIGGNGVIDNVVNTTGGPAQGTATVPSYVVNFP